MRQRHAVDIDMKHLMAPGGWPKSVVLRGLPAAGVLAVALSGCSTVDTVQTSNVNSSTSAVSSSADVLASDIELETSTTQPPATDPPTTPTKAPTTEPATALGRTNMGGKGETTTLPRTESPQEVSGTAVFTDATDSIEIDIPVHWEHELFDAGVELDIWYFEDAKSIFRPNMNLMSQYTGGLSMQEYLDLSVEVGVPGATDFALIGSHITVGPNGQEIGVFEYVAAGYHFVGLVQIEDGLARLLTLTSTESHFEELRAEVEPVMMSLRIIG